MKKRKFKFEKEGSDWYIVLPEWVGEKADLQMVAGADTLLDILAVGYNNIELFISTNDFEYSKSLSLIESDGDSGTYSFKDGAVSFSVWLCPVTKFVLGNIPKTIYFRPC